MYPGHKRKTLAAALKVLSGAEMTDESTVETTMKGYPVSVRADSSLWSVSVRLGRFPIAFDLFRRDRMMELIKPRSNVVFAEDALNRHYFAEATPAELVASVFEGELGRRVAQRRLTRIVVKPGTVELTDGYHYYGVHDATIGDSVELAIDLAQALEGACKGEPAVADRDARLYRDDSNMKATETALVKRSTDVAAALERQKRRDIRAVRVGKLAITAATIFLVLFSVLVALVS